MSENRPCTQTRKIHLCVQYVALTQTWSHWVCLITCRCRLQGDAPFNVILDGQSKFFFCLTFLIWKGLSHHWRAIHIFFRGCEKYVDCWKLCIKRGDKHHIVYVLDILWRRISPRFKFMSFRGVVEWRHINVQWNCQRGVHIWTSKASVYKAPR